MRLIRGAAGAGKTSLVFREFKAALRDGGPPARIIVPTATLVRHFQHELARDGMVFPPSAVISLSRFAAERAPGEKLVPDGLVRAVVRDSLLRLNLPEFADVAATEGMTATLLDTIALFENAACTPAKLAAVRKLSPNAKAFERIWRDAEATVHARGFVTRPELIARAAANPERLRIWMDGFLNFSPLETELIRALAATCELTLTLTDAPATDNIRKLALELNASDRLLPGPARKPRIAVVAAPTVEREADDIARRILVLREDGVPFREIGVAMRDPAAWLGLLRNTFERFGIPARFYFSNPLRHHPAAIFLNGLISCALNGWEFGAALDALGAHPGWGKCAAFDRFDFAVREAMPGRGADRLLALCEEDLSGRIAECVAIAPWREERLRPEDWGRRFEHLASALYRQGALDPPANYAAVESARSHVAGVRAWVEAVASIAPFWPDPDHAISLEEFWRVASEAVNDASVQVPDDRRDTVHVMSVYEARQWDIRALFVCGMTDRDFPRRHPQNLLFPDPEIDALVKAGIRVRKAAEQDREEIEVFESLKTRARDWLILTYAKHGAAGKSVESSRFLMDLNAPVERSRLCMPAHTSTTTPPGVPARIDTPELLTSLAAQHQRISLTALEDLAQCRFKFFAGRTLGLKGRPERPDERLQPKVTGLILHEALEAWLNVNRAGDFVALFETAFDKACREKHLPPGYRLEVERINFREIARKVTATEQWSPVESQAEVELTLDFPGGITVAGRVDRIDRMNARECVIVDYKSSRTARVEDMVESVTRLQGPLYALGVRERLGLETIAMMYVAVREDKRFGWGAVPGVSLDLKEMPPRWIEDARARAIQHIESFLSGAIRPHPVEPDKCKWCDYKEACRVEQAAFITIGAHGAG